MEKNDLVAQGRILAFAGELEIIEAAAPKEGEKPKNRTCKLTAYTGGIMRPAIPGVKVAVDLKGMKADDTVPICIDHQADAAHLLGQTNAVSTDGGKLTAVGEIFPADALSADALQALKLHDANFRWKTSVGMQMDEVKFIEDKQGVTVNGKSLVGPFYLVAKSTLKEISLVVSGADNRTSVGIAASAALFVKENLTMADETKPMEEPKPEVKAESPKPELAPEADPIAEIRAKMAAETKRIGKITAICAKHADLAAKAIEEGWTEEKAELEVLRADRPKAPAIHAGGTATAPMPMVLEAAAATACRLPNVEKAYPVEVLEAAHKQFHGRMGLQELLMEAAWANGYTPRSFRDLRGVLEAAFSTADVSGILSNVANKFLLEGFFSVETTWRLIAAIRSVNDFKAVTSYRLTGAEIYQQVGPDGELKHGTLGEESYTNKADTYGLLLSVTRTDIINDDLGALSTIPRKLGRGSGLKLNGIFWAAFLNDAAFFYTDDRNGNYISGATTTLGMVGLGLAIVKFRKQTDANGNVLSVQPRIILCPPELEAAALSLNASVSINTGGSSTVEQVPNANIYGGRFIPAVSAYLTAALPWYLLASPADLAVMEVAFLNGQESPTIETADANFDTLGIQMRGYHDFGVSKVDYRAGVKSKGQA